MSETVYIYQASLLCEDCGIRIIKRRIREGKHPALDCRNCGFKGTIGRRAARSAFDGRNAADWLKCPKCDEQAATFVDEDSDVFPQGALNGGGASDSVEHCGEHENCVNAIHAGTLPNGKPWLVGTWLGNELTSEGIARLREDIAERPQNPITALWAEWYATELSE